MNIYIHVVKRFELMESNSHSISVIEWATLFHTPHPVNQSIGKLEISADRAIRPLRIGGNWIRRIAGTGSGIFVKSKVRRRKPATSREVAGPITIGNHLSDGTSHRQPERLRSSRQTEANQTKPKSERFGTNQLSQAHPQLAKRQTYLIQLLTCTDKRKIEMAERRKRECVASQSNRGGRGEWNQIDTYSLCSRWIPFLATGIRSLFGVFETRRLRGGPLITRGRTRAVLFNQPFATFPVYSKLSRVKDYKSAGRKDNICR